MLMVHVLNIVARAVREPREREIDYILTHGSCEGCLDGCGCAQVIG